MTTGMDMRKCMEGGEEEILYLFTEQSKVLRALGQQDFHITPYRKTLTPVPLWDQQTKIPRVNFTWEEGEGERGRKRRRGTWKAREVGGRRRMQEKRERWREMNFSEGQSTQEAFLPFISCTSCGTDTLPLLYKNESVHTNSDTHVCDMWDLRTF